MALTIEEKQYFDQRFERIELARKGDRIYFTGLFNAALREISKKFDTVEKRLEAIEKRVTAVEQHLASVEQRMEQLERAVKQIKLDLHEVRARVFDTAQRTEWLSLVSRVEALEKNCRR
ncbi:MAG TPA: hypothetical protein VF272_01985 [Candidatus Saccharimonadia bacterium]